MFVCKICDEEYDENMRYMVFSSFQKPLDNSQV